MEIRKRTLSVQCVVVLLTALLLPSAVEAQLTAVLTGTVKDEQGGVIPGAIVRISSRALMGGSVRTTTDEQGRFRSPIPLSPGLYSLDIEVQGFLPHTEGNIRIGAGATPEIRVVVLQVGKLAQSIDVQTSGSQIESLNPGFETRFGPERVSNPGFRDSI